MEGFEARMRSRVGYIVAQRSGRVILRQSRRKTYTIMVRPPGVGHASRSPRADPGPATSPFPSDKNPPNMPNMTANAPVLPSPSGPQDSQIGRLGTRAAGSSL